jgi:hypothetical protein
VSVKLMGQLAGSVERKANLIPKTSSDSVFRKDTLSGSYDVRSFDC